MNITLEQVDFGEHHAALQRIREEVFVQEQGVTHELEWDGLDPQSLHVLARVDGEPVATARLTPDGRIGRMAVLPAFRRQGIGGCMLELLVELARRQERREVTLHAQTHALRFYERHGFVPFGPEFEEAGILHKSMRLSLDSSHK